MYPDTPLIDVWILNSVFTPPLYILPSNPVPMGLSLITDWNGIKFEVRDAVTQSYLGGYDMYYPCSGTVKDSIVTTGITPSMSATMQKYGGDTWILFY